MAISMPFLAYWTSQPVVVCIMERILLSACLCTSSHMGMATSGASVSRDGLQTREKARTGEEAAHDVGVCEVERLANCLKQLVEGGAALLRLLLAHGAAKHGLGGEGRQRSGARHFGLYERGAQRDKLAVAPSQRQLPLGRHRQLCCRIALRLSVAAG